MRVWWDVPEVRTAYENGKDFTGIDLKDVLFKSLNNYTLLDLTGADFRGCDLSSTKFDHTNVREARFSGANLVGCNFTDCCFGLGSAESIKAFDLISSANNIRFDITPVNLINNHYGFNILYSVENIRAPLDTSGQELIGYKALEKPSLKGEMLVIAKLLIPAESKRIVFKDDKCRCEWARVEEIYSPGQRYQFKLAYSFMWSKSLVYKVGENVYADKFDEDASVACSYGIHFFLTEEEAVKYGKQYFY